MDSEECGSYDALSCDLSDLIDDEWGLLNVDLCLGWW